LPDPVENPLSPVARSRRQSKSRRPSSIAGRREKKKKEREREREANKKKKKKKKKEKKEQCGSDGFIETICKLQTISIKSSLN
jgi:hypothetical protein